MLDEIKDSKQGNRIKHRKSQSL